MEQVASLPSAVAAISSEQPFSPLVEIYSGVNRRTKSGAKRGCSLEKETMARIIVEPASTGNDLPQGFVKALNLLNEKDIKLHSGTKLVSKHAVGVAEDPHKAPEHLRAGNMLARCHAATLY